TTISAPITEKVAPPLLLALWAVAVAILSRLLGNIRSLQEGTRIDRAVVDADLEMEVRPGRTAGTADRADHIARRHGLSALGPESGHMRIACDQPIAMADFHNLAITRFHAHETDLAIGRRMDRIARRAPEIQPGMQRRPAGEGIAAIAE